MKSCFEQRCRKWILVTINIILVTAIYSQDNSQSFRKIQYVYDKTGNLIEKVQFYNEKTGQLVNSFDVNKSNPFSNLPFPSIVDKFLFYNLSDVKLNEISLDKGLLNIISGFSEEIILDGGNAVSFYDIYEGNPDFTILTYYLIISIGEEPVAYSTVIYVLDYEGNNIFTLDQLNSPIGRSVITANGQYLAVEYEEEIDVTSQQVRKAGCLIFNLENNEVINYNAPDGFSQSVPQTSKDLIIISNHGVEENLYYIFDFDNNKAYSKLYKTSSLGKLRDINLEGFVFSEANSTSLHIDKYNDVFDEEEFK